MSSDEPGHFLLRKNLALNYMELVSDEKNNLYFDHDYNQAQSSSNVYLAHLHRTKQLLKGIFFTELGKSSCKVVDVGCGKGEFVDLLNTDSYFDCYGFDTSNSGENPKIQSRYLIQGDRDDEVDLIVLKYVLDYVSPPGILLNSLKDIFPNAYIYIEGPLIENTLQKNHFFDINLEQANYFSKDSYLNFFDGKVFRCGVVFGGEYQYVIARIRNLNSNLNPAYKNAEWSLFKMDELFPIMAEKIAETQKLIRDGGRIWVWGAGRKGTMFLHYLAQSTTLKSDKLGCVDQDLRKQGKYTPYTKVPIISNASLIDQIKVDDIVVILNSNYSNEIRDFLAIHLSFSVNIREF